MPVWTPPSLRRVRHQHRHQVISWSEQTERNHEHGLPLTSHGYGEVVSEMGVGTRLLLDTLFIEVTHPDSLVLGSNRQITQ